MNPSFCRCLALMPLLALAGCGGGTSPNPDTSEPVTISNAISNGDFRDDRNNRYYDIYVVDPTRSADVSVEMRSDDIDSLLLLYRKDSDGEFDLVAEDDDSGGELDAALDFRVERGESYRIVATTAQADERGEYEVRFSPELGRPALVLPKTNAQTQGMDFAAGGAQKEVKAEMDRVGARLKSALTQRVPREQVRQLSACAETKQFGSREGGKLAPKVLIAPTFDV